MISRYLIGMSLAVAVIANLTAYLLGAHTTTGLLLIGFVLGVIAGIVRPIVWCDRGDVGFGCLGLVVRLRDTNRWRLLFSERNAQHVAGPLWRSQRRLMVRMGSWQLNVRFKGGAA